jgi:hypothetical protein
MLLTCSRLGEIAVVLLNQLILIAMAELACKGALASRRFPSGIRAAVLYGAFANVFVGLWHHIVSSDVTV